MTSHNDKHTDGNPDNAPLREHVFDGIQEYDNKLPNWWLMTLYGAIVFSIVYWFFYHKTGVGASPEEKFILAQKRAVAHAAQSGESDFSDQQLLAMSADTGFVGSGKTAFATNCIACHGGNAEGGMGPSLRDSDWIHGNQPSQIYRVIQEGIPAKGMPAWKSILGQTRTAEIAAFLISLNPEGVSTGDLIEPAATPAAAGEP